MNILNLLNDEEINAFVRYKNYNSNQVVFDEYALCEYIGIVLEGEVLIKTYTYLEKEETFTSIKKGECFGQHLIFSKTPFYLGIAITKFKTKIAMISKTNLLKLFKINQSFLEGYLTLICTDSVNIKQQAKLLAHKNIRDRIMYYFNQKSIDRCITIKSVTDLANILSIPRAFP